LQRFGAIPPVAQENRKSDGWEFELVDMLQAQRQGLGRRDRQRLK